MTLEIKVKRVKSSIRKLSCKGCIFDKENDLRCYKPTELEECWDEVTGIDYIFVEDKDETKEN